VSEGRATRAQMEELWHLLAHHLLDTLRTAQPGELKASFVNVTRAFLADNGITSESVKGARSDGAEELAALLDGMPDFGALERNKSN
jgi:hypothetical protein